MPHPEKNIKDSSLFIDLPGFPSPCIITVDNFFPDMLLSTANNILYIIKFSVDFEINVDNNENRKYEKYLDVIMKCHLTTIKVKFVNISISSLGNFGNPCDTFM